MRRAGGTGAWGVHRAGGLQGIRGLRRMGRAVGGMELGGAPRGWGGLGGWGGVGMGGHIGMGEPKRMRGTGGLYGAEGGTQSWGGPACGPPAQPRSPQDGIHREVRGRHHPLQREIHQNPPGGARWAGLGGGVPGGDSGGAGGLPGSTDTPPTAPPDPLLCKFADGGQKKRQSQGKFVSNGRAWARDGDTVRGEGTGIWGGLGGLQGSTDPSPPSIRAP